jgi:hypothetical protein
MTEHLKRRSQSITACRLVSILLAVVCLSLAGCTSSHSPKVTDIATNFTNYHQVTAAPVYVNPELAMSCIGASLGQVEEAREKHGPHANTAITIYMNDPAVKTFPARTQPYPVGSVIIKRKSIHGYNMGNSSNRVQPAANTGVGGMIKRPPGYDPANGDWEYFYFENPKKIESGRIASCVQCHVSAKGSDYVFGSWQRIGNSPIGPPRRGE